MWGSQGGETQLHVGKRVEDGERNLSRNRFLRWGEGNEEQRENWLHRHCDRPQGMLGRKGGKTRRDG